MKFVGSMGLLAALALNAAPVMAKSHKGTTPKTAKACAAHAKEGWNWQDGKCVKGEAAANKATETTKATEATKTEKAPEAAPPANHAEGIE